MKSVREFDGVHALGSGSRYFLHIVTTSETFFSILKNNLNLWLPGGRMAGGIVREFEMNMYALLYLKWIINKDLLYSTWNSAQYYMAAWLGRKFGREYIHG